MEDKVLETVVNGIKYTMLKDVLVKPLDPVMVTKEITEQIPTGEVDEDGSISMIHKLKLRRQSLNIQQVQY